MGAPVAVPGAATPFGTPAVGQPTGIGAISRPAPLGGATPQLPFGAGQAVGGAVAVAWGAPAGGGGGVAAPTAQLNPSALQAKAAVDELVVAAAEAAQAAEAVPATAMDMLSPEDKAAFQSAAPFEAGKIPECEPPEELCA